MSTIEQMSEQTSQGETKSVSGIPIACTLTPEEFQERKGEHLRRAGQSLLETVERPDGYAFRFPGEMYDDLSKIVGLERRCCSFLRFSLISEPGNGPVWLEVTGPAEAKTSLATFWS